VNTKLYYRRYLPHWYPPGAPLFITWRLFGSLPRSVLELLERNKKLSEGKRFALADAELDRGSTGPLWLKEPRVAALLVETLRHGQKMKAFDLHAYVVMANHVHVLLTPKLDVVRILRGIKRRSAAEAKRVLGRSGRRFWAEESFDHWCRSEAEFARCKAYIERNPVKAGLVARPADWAWSSARNTGL
jgi:REP element-mobilizing transposase RayT